MCSGNGQHKGGCTCGRTLGRTPSDAPDGRGTAVASPAAPAIAVFGMGCFWDAERRFAKVPGVRATRVGYQGGLQVAPTYAAVKKGGTGHAEVVQVTYDPSHVSYEALLDLFWRGHDPTQGFRQGADVGSQYRSAIYATTQEQLALAQRSRETAVYRRLVPGGRTITTEIAIARPFWPAEEEHQRYFERNPDATCAAGKASQVRALSQRPLPPGGRSVPFWPPPESTTGWTPGLKKDPTAHASNIPTFPGPVPLKGTPKLPATDLNSWALAAYLKGKLGPGANLECEGLKAQYMAFQQQLFELWRDTVLGPSCRKAVSVGLSGVAQSIGGYCLTQGEPFPCAPNDDPCTVGWLAGQLGCAPDDGLCQAEALVAMASLGPASANASCVRGWAGAFGKSLSKSLPTCQEYFGAVAKWHEFAEGQGALAATNQVISTLALLPNGNPLAAPGTPNHVYFKMRTALAAAIVLNCAWATDIGFYEAGGNFPIPQLEFHLACSPAVQLLFPTGECLCPWAMGQLQIPATLLSAVGCK